MNGEFQRNAGIPLDLEWVESARVNLPATERRAATHKARRSIKKEWQAAWLLRAVTCIDLTTLDGDDTPEKVSRLCHKANTPVRQDLVTSLGMEDAKVMVGAVCVYSARVLDAVRAMEQVKCHIPIASGALFSNSTIGSSSFSLGFCRAKLFSLVLLPSPLPFDFVQKKATNAPIRRVPTITATAQFAAMKGALERRTSA